MCVIINHIPIQITCIFLTSHDIAILDDEEYGLQIQKLSISPHDDSQFGSSSALFLSNHQQTRSKRDFGSSLQMSGMDSEEEVNLGDPKMDWNQRFMAETPCYIVNFIFVMEEDIHEEFKLKFKSVIAMDPYWKLKFILAKAMRKRESFEDMVNLTVGILKEDAE